MPSLPEHGANPKLLYRRLGMEEPEEVLDFSENVNPLGIPESVRKAWPGLIRLLPHYPEPDGEPFRSDAARFHGVPSEMVMVGNGAAELFSVIADRYRGKRALLIHPTFSEYKATLLAKGALCVDLTVDPSDAALPVGRIKQAMEDADVIYLCNPNNPTGERIPEEKMLELAGHGRGCGCELVIDEAFMDFAGEAHSFVPHLAEHPHVAVMRSMTKMYAIPGIRLGYMVASPQRIKEHRKAAPHWNVNGIAAQIGSLCLQEAEFRERSVLYSRTVREELTAFLVAAGCTVTNSETNYVSFRPPADPAGLYESLLRQGIVLRHSENFLGMDGQWFRVGMKEEWKMDRLKEALARWFEETSPS
ncbi:threonine-phosphate decarboxylase CobD [Edaphobacillus lindanitolerans]|uniref:threonine-phosphate decarboxylase n=1 Tax=Edaphobacillus lindanitolerans TaxID=550447 RepID=A0A1U7PLY1_9BACI|nr:threonine-phosphate decarboxylase CobD [Edaphobacillus lindanitolerans]SIT69900.1 L-threonine O-3-phosphate decarboxylase [Edaphobacillus lindanitolerans]